MFTFCLSYLLIGWGGLAQRCKEWKKNHIVLLGENAKDCLSRTFQLIDKTVVQNLSCYPLAHGLGFLFIQILGNALNHLLCNSLSIVTGWAMVRVGWYDTHVMWKEREREETSSSRVYLLCDFRSWIISLKCPHAPASLQIFRKLVVWDPPFQGRTMFDSEMWLHFMLRMHGRKQWANHVERESQKRQCIFRNNLVHDQSHWYGLCHVYSWMGLPTAIGQWSVFRKNHGRKYIDFFDE